MQKGHFLTVTTVAIFLILVVGVNATYSNIIKKRDENIIRIAFMNGSINALKMDIDRIKALKKNKMLLKSAVMAAADVYVREVEALNEQNYSGAQIGKNAYTAVAGPYGIRYREIFVPDP